MKRLPLLLSPALASALFITGIAAFAQSPPSTVPNVPIRIRPGDVQRIPGVQSIPDFIKPDPNRFNIAAADLVLEKLDVENLGGDRFQLTATLRNGSTTGIGQAYPGGGQLAIERTSGGTILTKPSDAFVALPDGGTTLALRPIPALEYGQAITLSATTQGRAIFSASAVPDAYRPDVPTKPLPEKNPNNNRKEISTLIPRKHTLTSRTLTNLTSGLLNKVQIRLDRDQSYVKIPGFGEESWSIPEKQYDAFLTKVRYYVHDINSTNVELGINQRSLALSLDFETDGSEIVGVGVAPDINAGSITALVKLPLSYDAATQYLSYGEPEVNVNVANPSFNGPLGPLLDAFLPEINQSASQSIKKLFKEPKLKRQIEYQMNQQIRDLLVLQGRIVGVTIDSNEITFDVEAGA